MLKKILFLIGFIGLSNLSTAQFQFTRQTSFDLISTSLVFLELLQDSNDDIWIACQSNKVLRFDGTDWILYDNNSLNLNGFSFMQDVYEDPEGRVWFMTSGGGLTYFQNDTWTTFTTTNGLLTNVNYSAIYYNGKMYFSGSSGVMVYDNISWTEEDLPNVFAGDSHFEIDEQGQLWITFEGNNSTFRLNGSTWEEINTTNSGICYDDLNNVHKTGAGNLWFYGPDGKVCQYDGTEFNSEHELPNWGIGLGDKVTAIDSDGNSDDIWIATNGQGSNGIVHRKNGVNIYYDTDDGLSTNWIKDLIVANDGQTIYAIITGSFYTGSMTVSTQQNSATKINLNVYPNPTTGKVYLASVNNAVLENIRIDVFSVNGQRQLTKDQKISEVLDLSELASGWYALRIFSSDEVVYNQRIYKE